ncbi:hypothetical protein KL919_002847 [Ogataea angusta]|nr:hypothetical protein KL919_002847 [Ogataea angusta]
MGNSPSKDGSSTSSVTTSGSSPDDPDPSRKPRPDKTHLTNELRSSKHNINTNNDNNGQLIQTHTTATATDDINDGGITTLVSPFDDENDVSTWTISKRPCAEDDNSYGLEIAASMAQTLNISRSPLRDVTEEVCSSFDSNTDSCFTNGSSSSISSTTTPPHSKETNLYPIAEQSKESTPDLKSSKISTSSDAAESLAHFFLAKDASKCNSGSVTRKPASAAMNIDGVIERLVEAGLAKRSPKKFMVSGAEIKVICAKARDVFMRQPTLLELAAPVKIVGDIHGQFNDLIRIFKLCGFPPNANYLFLGDYVDRGKQSLETIILLLCLKIKYPENFFMLRGNHESANVTKMYGFYDECKRRANLKVWKNLVDVFNTLPVAATIADRIFCVHGGLSPQLTDLNQIKNIQRPTDVPESGLLADLLWSDPQDPTQGSSKASISLSGDWCENDRGVSYCFSKKVVQKFCDHFQFDLVARGHMVVEEGYEFYSKRKLVTIFSAPNYCGEFDNWGAVMNVNKKLMCSFELLKPFSVKRKK